MNNNVSGANDVEINNFTTGEKRNLKHSNSSQKNLLYNNNFKENKKPLNLGGTRNCLYINDYPYISIGRNINLPLLVVLFVCCIYIYIFYFFFIDSGPFLQKLFNYSFLIYIISHIISIFLNPGIPSYEYYTKILDDMKFQSLNDLDCSECKICNLTHKLTDKIGHCEKCDVCYFSYDHHCIWTGHCGARNNDVCFLIFLIAVFIFILICFAMILVKIIRLFI